MMFVCQVYLSKIFGYFYGKIGVLYLSNELVEILIIYFLFKCSNRSKLNISNKPFRIDGNEDQFSVPSKSAQAVLLTGVLRGLGLLSLLLIVSFEIYAVQLQSGMSTSPPAF